jgi:hypothetical protein
LYAIKKNIFAPQTFEKVAKTVVKITFYLNSFQASKYSNLKFIFRFERLPDNKCIWRQQTNRDKFEFKPGTISMELKILKKQFQQEEINVSSI